MDKGKRIVGDERWKRIGLDRQGLSVELVVVGSGSLERSRSSFALCRWSLSFEADAHGSKCISDLGFVQHVSKRSVCLSRQFPVSVLSDMLRYRCSLLNEKMNQQGRMTQS